ncbi:MAG: bifunctional adenosylcobinamide kinase/adenosylcobinamide-phosphate guanylyltransferase [Lachnospiraceae bacterium]|jgi:adenosylcobinamide kinase/adenosylcobinamide-phosphate guanylyltransferase
MILVTGGLGSGRHEFVKNKFPGREICEFGPEQVKEILAQGGQVSAAAEDLVRDHPEAVVITQEVGCGIVPADPFERKWREELGRAACALASASETVILMTCGIGKAIKGRILR